MNEGTPVLVGEFVFEDEKQQSVRYLQVDGMAIGRTVYIDIDKYSLKQTFGVPPRRIKITIEGVA